MDETINFEAQRRAMVASQLRTSGIADPTLLAVMARVPREAFVPEAHRAAAYTDRPVPLSTTRAMNPPAATGALIEALQLDRDDRVLVVGAASGYALAVVAALAAEAIGVDADESLAEGARTLVPEAELVSGPPAEGHRARAPYDAILIDGAIERVPDALVEQLAPDGRLAVALLDAGVTRLAIGRRGGSGFALHSFTDSEAVVLPGFERPKMFTF